MSSVYVNVPLECSRRTHELQYNNTAVLEAPEGTALHEGAYASCWMTCICTALALNTVSDLSQQYIEYIPIRIGRSSRKEF